MRIIFIFILLAVTLGAMPEAFARGGTSADDCSVNSLDPDCKIFTVIIEHSHFDTDDLRIPAASTMVFTNRDKIEHNIQIMNQDGNVKDLGLQAPGTDTSTKLTAPGKYGVKCALTPQAKMTVDVK